MSQPTRRTMLKGIGAGAATAFVPLGMMGPAEAAKIGAPESPKLPGGIKTYIRAYRNWSEAIQVDAVWTAVPANAEEVVLLANWAKANGYKIRPRGQAHTWCPITLSGEEKNYSKVLLVDTRNGLTKLQVKPGDKAHVVVGTGISQEELLNALAQRGLGILHHPAPGDITVGGMLAIGGHGTGIPAQGEKLSPGHSYGSISNLVLELEAVVYDKAAKKYVLKRFSRDDKQIGPLLVSLGRSFITEVTLRVGPEQKMRCQSFMDVPLSELLAEPGSSGRTAMSYLDQTGRIEIICFAHTRHPWLKVWSVAPDKPAESREVSGPFNYTFSDQLSRGVLNIARSVTLGAEGLTPLMGSIQWSAVNSGLRRTKTSDIWGSAKDLMMYIRPSTLRVTANGYAVLCERKNIQRVLNDFYKKYQALNDSYRWRLRYPVNGPLEIRVVGLDRPEDTGIPGAAEALLSPTRPAADHPEWDCAVYFDVLTLPGTRGAEQYYAEMEQWMFAHYTGNYARVRVEWSKGWGYTSQSAWKNKGVLTKKVPQSLTHPGKKDSDYAAATAALRKMDPYNIFTAPLHQVLIGEDEILGEVKPVDWIPPQG